MTDDLYTWSVLPAAKHLFNRHLSKHGVGAYQEILQQVGITFEAVRHKAESVSLPTCTISQESAAHDRLSGCSPPPATFTERIEVLNTQIRQLRDAYVSAENTATALQVKSDNKDEQLARLQQQNKSLQAANLRLRTTYLKQGEMVRLHKQKADSLEKRMLLVRRAISWEEEALNNKS